MVESSSDSDRHWLVSASPKKPIQKRFWVGFSIAANLARPTDRSLSTSNKTSFLEQPVEGVGTSLRKGVVQWPSNSCLMGCGNWSNRSSQSPRRSPRAEGAVGGQGMSHRHCIRPAQWDSLGDAAARDGLWLWNELLATTARLAGAWYLAVDPLLFAGLAGTLRAD